LRIAIVTPSLRAGGAERSSVLLARGLLARGHWIKVITISGPASDFYQLPAGAERGALGLAAVSQTAWQGLVNNGRRLRTLRKLILAHQPDVVVSHIHQTNILTLTSLVGTHYPVIAVEHGDPLLNPTGRVWERLRRVTYRRAAAVVCVSESIREQFGWLSDALTYVVPNPVTTYDEEPDDNHWFPVDGMNSIVGMGRMVPVKGFDLLLSAFALVAPRHPNWQLLLLGEGALRSELTQRAAALGLQERVFLPGQVKNPQSILRRCQIFALASQTEGFPYALLEAMACGLAVVATDCGAGPREILRNGEVGWLVPNGDAEALAAALDRLMSNESERARLAALAPEVLSRFALEAVTARWEELCTQALSR
jgi:glycosyltransferase involved in cell wall biosynthesis